MTRHLLNFATHLSLLLCVLTIVLWVRSRYTTDQFSWWTGSGRGQNTYFVSHQNGWLELYREWPQDLKVVASHASVIAGTALLPVVRLAAMAVIGVRARRRKYAARCQSCGYDLRGTPDRCPECGTVPAQAAPAAA